MATITNRIILHNTFCSRKTIHAVTLDSRN